MLLHIAHHVHQHVTTWAAAAARRQQLPTGIKTVQVNLQHNAVAAQGLVVHMPVSMAMAQTAAQTTSQGCCTPTD